MAGYQDDATVNIRIITGKLLKTTLVLSRIKPNIDEVRGAKMIVVTNSVQKNVGLGFNMTRNHHTKIRKQNYLANNVLQNTSNSLSDDPSIAWRPPYYPE